MPPQEERGQRSGQHRPGANMELARPDLRGGPCGLQPMPAQSRPQNATAICCSARPVGIGRPWATPASAGFAGHCLMHWLAPASAHGWPRATGWRWCWRRAFPPPMPARRRLLAAYGGVRVKSADQRRDCRCVLPYQTLQRAWQQHALGSDIRHHAGNTCGQAVQHLARSCPWTWCRSGTPAPRPRTRPLEHKRSRVLYRNQTVAERRRRHPGRKWTLAAASTSGHAHAS